MQTCAEHSSKSAIVSKHLVTVWTKGDVPYDPKVNKQRMNLLKYNVLRRSIHQSRRKIVDTAIIDATKVERRLEKSVSHVTFY